MDENNKKYFWLRLKRDFFKRHDIRIIESMPNGKDYLLFYLKLLVESVDHEGNLRFSNEIPYNEDMLSVITNTNVDIVRSAIKIFTELGMMELLDDGTYFMSEVNKMIGSETEWARKKREYRERQKQLGQCPQDVLPMSDKSKSIEIEKDIEIEKENNTNICIIKEKRTNSRFSKPTIEEIDEYIKNYCLEKHKCKPLIDANTFYNFYESKNWYVGKNKMKDWKASVRMWISKEIAQNPNLAKPKEEVYRPYRGDNDF